MNKATYTKRAYAQMDRDVIKSYFEPHVDKQMAPVLESRNKHLPDTERIRYDVSIKYRGKLGAGENLMFGLCLSFVGSITMDDMIEIAGALHEFEVYEYQPWEYCGMHFTLGDGDDQLAVQFCEGMFEIWLRAWHPDHIGGL